MYDGIPSTYQGWTVGAQPNLAMFDRVEIVRGATGLVTGVGIHAAGGHAMAACCDIGERAQVVKMMDAIISQWGRLDVLIHKASTYPDLGPFEASSVDDLERIMRVNVKAAGMSPMRRGHTCSVRGRAVSS